MSENTTADKNPAPTDLPAPNGHASNGVTAHESQDSGNAAPSAASSVKKRKKKKPAAKAGAAPAPDASADPVEQQIAPADLPPQQDFAAEATPVAASAPADSDPTPAETIVEPSASAADPVADPVAAPVTDPAPAVTAEAPAADAAPEAAAPAVDLLRLRLKIWTDPGTGKRFLMPSAFMRDVVNGQPVSDVMYAYAISDEETKLVLLRAHEWNTLPFYYFYEDGPAPRASSRPMDVVVSGGRPS